MDVVLHPDFEQNRHVYPSYHKPVGEDSGATTLARGTWDGTTLIDVLRIEPADSARAATPAPARR